MLWCFSRAVAAGSAGLGAVALPWAHRRGAAAAEAPTREEGSGSSPGTGREQKGGREGWGHLEVLAVCCRAWLLPSLEALRVGGGQGGAGVGSGHAGEGWWKSWRSFIAAAVNVRVLTGPGN